jgi:nucleoside-diphosphate-sugar epimerase
MRAAATAIRPRRAPGQAHFLVTGATGFLGAHLLRALLSRGHAVTALVRHGRSGPAEERFRRVLGWLGVGPKEASRAKVVAGDVAEERFGLAEREWRDLAAGVDEVVHCAASTAFTESRRTELERVNIRGTAITLALAAAGSTASFHLVSSAYAAGRVEGTVTEDWCEPPGFTNAYEESKQRAEALARAACAGCGVRLTIYRPAIVYGDSVSGRSLRFNALYYPIRTLLLLRDIYGEDLRRDGARARACGVEGRPGGDLLLPLRVETDAEAALDLVPVDHFARAFMALRDGAPEGGIFHIASGAPVPVETVMDSIRRRYRIEGLTAVPRGAGNGPPRTALERLFDGYLESYRPYMLDRRRFDDRLARPHLEAAGLRCPRFTDAVFKRVMGYAEEVGWGKRLFAPP